MVSVDTTLYTAQTRGKARVLDALIRFQTGVGITCRTFQDAHQAGNQGPEVFDQSQIRSQERNTEACTELNLATSGTGSASGVAPTPTTPVKHIIMVGDGVPDIQTKPPAVGALGYGGVITRPAVLEKADWFIWDFQELIDILDAQG